MAQKKSFFKRTSTKIALITLLCIVILIIGFIPLSIVLVMYQTLIVRALIAAAGIIWAIVTDFVILTRSNYFKLWRQYRHQRKHTRMHQTIALYPEYQALRKKYPLSIRRYEQHIRHHHASMSEDEMIEQALSVSEEEWAAREAFRREKKEEWKSYNQHAPNKNGSLA